ncbi:MAG: hypothetical protein QOF97_395 [Acidimicrobiaceae bacterium]|jgi:hypothetical protein
MSAHRRTFVVITAALALALLAACGSDKKTPAASASSGPAATTTTTAAFDETAAKAQITKAFETFFNGTVTDQNLKLQQLAEPDKLKTLFNENFTKNATVAAMTVAQVETITFGTDKTKADVVYTLVVSGTPALQHFGGSAVFTGGYWRITTASFCDITYIGATQPPECTS